MTHVFISYTRADSHFARLLKFELEKEGLNPWIDTERLLAGDDWREGIDEAILYSYAVIVVKSPDAFQSQYVTYEWAYALGIEIPIIPILIKPTQFHPRLSVIQHLDFTNADPNLQPWKSLVDRLKQLHPDSGNFRVQLPRNTPAAIKRAVEALDSPNPRDRGEALGSLAVLNHPAIREILAQVLYHPFRDMNVISAYFLAKLYNDKRAAPVIEEMLLGKNGMDRINAAEVAYKVWDTNIVNALIACLSDARIGQNFEGKTVSVASVASEALSYIGTPEALVAVDQYVRKQIDIDGSKPS